MNTSLELRLIELVRQREAINASIASLVLEIVGQPGFPTAEGASPSPSKAPGKRGRPRKATRAVGAEAAAPVDTGRHRGRPKGAKNKPKRRTRAVAAPRSAVTAASTPKVAKKSARKGSRGRPKGAKNKKTLLLEAALAAAAR